MSEDLSHLHPAAQQIARLPVAERLGYVRADWWIGYPRAAEAVQRLETLLAWPSKQRMPNLLLIGPTNNGKSRTGAHGQREWKPTSEHSGKRCLTRHRSARMLSPKRQAPTTSGHKRSSPDDGREDLRADCTNCFGLCCVALPFARSADFAVDKNAGQPCSNLQADFRCGIHTRLREKGFSGCTAFDCFGAGQKVSQITFGGTNWRQEPQSARHMFAVFPVMRQLHELLWYLTEALDHAPARPIHKDLRSALTRVEGITRGSAESLLELDMAALRSEINALLLRASELIRAKVPGRKKNHRGADLIGARLAGADLRGANLRGALLIAADLTKADLSMADLIGADFRDVDLSGADLTGSIFLTQAQVNAAKGDAATKLPPTLSRPAHW